MNESNGVYNYSNIDEAIEAFKTGEILIVQDDEGRENEGDFICAGDKITPETINFMAKYGRGLICAPISEQIAHKFNLPLMVPKNGESHATAFTISIDAANNISTGISAFDRYYTIKLLSDPNSHSFDFVRPGHIFPLISNPGGLKTREGHTEATIELCKLSGLNEVGVICEILNEDGSMSRTPELFELAEKFNLKIIHIKQILNKLEQETKNLSFLSHLKITEVKKELNI